jgi:CRP-like cAMP-binding protein
MESIVFNQHLLDNHWLSKVFSASDLAELLKVTSLVEYRKRETIVKRGEFATHLVFLLEGFVKLEIEEGKRDFIIDIEKGMNFIGLPLALTLEKHIFSIVTLSDAKVIFFPVNVIKDILKTNARFSQEIIRYGNEAFVVPLLEKLRSASQNNIRGRLAKLLIHLSMDVHCSNKFTLLISRMEMSHMIGFSRENVIRVLAEFNTEGIIDVNSKILEIKNIARLEELAKYS